MKVFLELVDNGTPAKGFSRRLNMTLDDIRFYRTLVGFYRRYVAMSDEIIKIRGLDIESGDKRAMIAKVREDFKNAEEV